MHTLREQCLQKQTSIIEQMEQPAAERGDSVSFAILGGYHRKLLACDTQSMIWNHSCVGAEKIGVHQEDT
jgi:hypothetical protein